MSIQSPTCPIVRIVTCLIVVLGAALCSQAHADLEQVEEHYVFNEYDEALQLLAQLAAADPDAAGASLDHQVWRARCLVQAGRGDEAVEVFCLIQHLDAAWRPDPILVPEDERDVFARALDACMRGPALLSILTDPAGAKAWLDGRFLSGETPIHDLEHEAGSYDLSLQLEGHHEFTDRIEVRRPRTVIERALQPLPSSILPPPSPSFQPNITRGGAVTRSLIPGLGQFYKQQPTKGAVVLGAATVTAGMAVWGHLQHNARIDDMDRAYDDYMMAVSSDELVRTFTIYRDRVAALQRSDNLRDIGLYAFVGVYVFNLIDAALGFPLGEKNVSVSAAATHPGEARLAVCIAGR